MGGSDDWPRAEAKIDPETELAEKWEQHKEGYTQNTQALRDLMKDGFEAREQDKEDLHPAVKVLVSTLLAVALAVAIGQAFVVWDVWVATGLTALALTTIAGVYVWDGEA